ncbi:Methyltransferase small domain-containing protein [Micromonospora pattaloongensis]|uniref:Methyltransferase small domain-containing protein n=1 Tax=Micromonospora pattaloongensis TaxID=405436 RepID=A0A1H3K8L4_9ACTN|nr:methyltransferase [Micromonospora pattaloongensis]SDY47824.1 Methyltransferase small domain-containing protein [Micromonospora pattaloongensis]
MPEPDIHAPFPGLLSPTGIDQLREALLSAGYTAAGIAARLGPEATAGVARNDFRMALRMTEDRDRLGTLIRLFVCGQTEPEETVAAALAPLPLAEARAAGLVERAPADPDGVTGLRQGVDLEPYGESWWVLSDVPAAARPGRPLPADHVLGVGGASTTLAGATIRRPVGAALDLGTGCGVQSLHLATHAGTVTATDLSVRALRFAATTAALNGQQWELLQGDLVAPVAGRRFDLVVSNPPFVVGPGTATHTYRDSGRVGDGVCAELAAAAPGLLTDGGVMQYLANWVHVAGEDWGERVAGWFAGTGLDAWVIQREVADPVGYVNLWLADASEAADPQRAAAWLDWFDAHKVEAVGFGLITLRNSGHADPVVRVEDLRQAVEPPLGEHVAAWFDRQDWLRSRDAGALLAARYRAADGLQLRQEATMGPEGWAVDRQVLALPHGLRWTEEVDPLVLALVGGCDGRVPLRDQIALLAVAHDVPEAELAEAAVPIITHLVERSVILPA